MVGAKGAGFNIFLKDGNCASLVHTRILLEGETL